MSKDQKRTIDISEELFRRLQKERTDFERGINLEYDFEMTIWEFIKIAGLRGKSR